MLCSPCGATDSAAPCMPAASMSPAPLLESPPRTYVFSVLIFLVGKYYYYAPQGCSQAPGKSRMSSHPNEDIRGASGPAFSHPSEDISAALGAEVLSKRGHMTPAQP